MSCFQGLFFCPEAFSLLLHNFCIYHISPPGHEVCNSVTWLQIVVRYIYIYWCVSLCVVFSYYSAGLVSFIELYYPHHFLSGTFFKRYCSWEPMLLALMNLHFLLMTCQIRLPRFSTFLGKHYLFIFISVYSHLLQTFLCILILILMVPPPEKDVLGISTTH